MTSIDLTKFTNLTYLSVSGCGKLTSLDVSVCPNLKVLDCTETNSITSLDLSSNLALEEVKIPPELDENTIIWPGQGNSLKVIYMTSTKFVNLDTSGMPLLEEVYAPSCFELETVDFTKNPRLKVFEYSGDFSFSDGVNSLDKLKIGSKSTLEVLDIDRPYFKELDLSGFTGLEVLHICVNCETPVDLSSCTNLSELDLAYYDADVMDLTYLNELDVLRVSGDMKEFVVPASNDDYYDELAIIYCDNLESIDFSNVENATIENMDLSSLQLINTLDLSNVHSIGTLRLNHAPLVSIYLSDYTADKVNIQTDYRSNYVYEGTGDSIDMKSIDPKFDYSKVTNLKGATIGAKGFEKITGNEITYTYLYNDTEGIVCGIDAANITLYDPATATTETPTTEEPTTETSTIEATTEATNTEVQTTQAPEASIETTTTEKTEPEPDNAPSTGDNNVPLLVFAVALISFAGLTIFSRKIMEKNTSK